MGTFDEDFQKSFKKLIEDVACMRKAIDESTTKINQLGQENKILHKQVEELVLENYMLKDRIADMEQYSRKNNIIVVTKKHPMCQKPNCAGERKNCSQW